VATPTEAEDKDHVLEQRIRERAYKIWEDAGRPEGRQLEHWELAKFAIAEQDALPTMTVKAPSLAAEE
jgi:hypothetical protein